MDFDFYLVIYRRTRTITFYTYVYVLFILFFNFQQRDLVPFNHSEYLD